MRAVLGVVGVEPPVQQLRSCGRHRDAGAAAGLERLGDLVHRPAVVGNVFEHLGAHHAVEGLPFGEPTLDVEVPRGNRHPARRRRLEERLEQRRIVVGAHDLESVFGEQDRLLSTGAAQIQNAGAVREPQQAQVDLIDADGRQSAVRVAPPHDDLAVPAYFQQHLELDLGE